MNKKEIYLKANDGFLNTDPIDAMKDWLSTEQGQREYEEWLDENYDK